MLLSFVALASLGDFRDHPGLFFFALTACFVALVVWSRWPPATGLSLTRLLLLAAALRALFLPLPPSLSEDVYRYLWDGRVLLAGENPYLLAPDAGTLVELRDSLWSKTEHRSVETVYPPLALGVFSIATLFPGSFFAYKAILVLFDLLGCAALLALARNEGIATSRVVWYAWNPLVVLEGAGMGHVDFLGVPFSILALWLLSRRGRGSKESGSETALAAVAASAGVLIKLVPVVSLPLWIHLSSRRLLFGGVALGILGVVGVATSVWTGGFPPGLLVYGVSWEFNGPLFEPLWRMISWLSLDQWIHRGFDSVRSAVGGSWFIEPLYPLVYPQLLAKAMLMIVLVALVVRSLRWRLGKRPLCEGTNRLYVGMLLLSATVYPWYLAWALPLAALLDQRAVLLLSWSIQFAYLPSLLGVEFFPVGYLLVWAPVALLAMFRMSPSRPSRVNLSSKKVGHESMNLQNDEPTNP